MPNKTIGVKFTQQSGIDNCASSALMITLAFMQFYKSKSRIMPPILRISDKFRKEILKRMHKLDSHPVANRRYNIANRPIIICPKCGKI